MKYDDDAVVVTLTALDLEYAALRVYLTHLRTCCHPAGTIFEVGRLPDAPVHIVAAVVGAGTATAAALTERAIRTFQPKALFFLGIAGALHSDLRLGDVVVATKVYAYQGRRDDDDGVHSRPETYHAPHRLEQTARHVARSSAWQAGLPSRTTGHPPAVHFKPVAAGDVVLNSRSSSLARQLHHLYNDAVAIEMESAGAARASQLNNSLPILTIRGISDRADGAKHTTDHDGWQAIAAANAAAFTAALIRQYATQGAA